MFLNSIRFNLSLDYSYRHIGMHAYNSVLQNELNVFRESKFVQYHRFFKSEMQSLRSCLYLKHHQKQTFVSLAPKILALISSWRCNFGLDQLHVKLPLPLAVRLLIKFKLNRNRTETIILNFRTDAPHYVMANANIFFFRTCKFVVMYFWLCLQPKKTSLLLDTGPLGSQPRLQVFSTCCSEVQQAPKRMKKKTLALSDRGI